MKDHLQDIFREEANEQLSQLENALLELESGRTNPALINEVFRVLHTIKGAAGMCGFDEIADFAHLVESVLDLVRSGTLGASTDLVTLVLRASDIIRRMVAGDICSGDGEISEIEERLGALLAVSPLSQYSAKTVASAVSKAGEGPIRTFRINLAIKPSILDQGSNPIDLFRELAALGPCRITANMEAIPSLPDLKPASCHVSWEIILTTTAGENDIRDVFIFMEGDYSLDIELVPDAEEKMEGVPGSVPEIGEILIERGDLDRTGLNAALSRQKRLGEILVQSGNLPLEKLNLALSEQSHLREMERLRQSRESAASMRVPAAKLDHLVNLVGELVTAQSRLSLCANEINSVDFIYDMDVNKLCEQWNHFGGMLRDVAEDVERLAAELRETSMGLRILPIGTTFGRFRRLVRDLATELGKDVELVTEGEETEIDKNVIERLVDPIAHIIRNCLDHGIEMPEQRIATGKPSRGKISLSAVHIGDCIEIQVSDDGAGLDAAAIRKTAVSRGIIPAGLKMEDRELYPLICEPGFSTSTSVTGISGRGVGMDVVRQAIEALQGTLGIGSTPDSGTSIIIRLPLTLAIIETLQVRIGEERFVLPLNQVEECIDLSRQELAECHGRDLVNLRGEPVPFLLLRERFEITGDRPEIEQVVITRLEGERFGLVVDEVLCQSQSVIKPLGRLFRKVEGVSGSTILGDGSVALILDLAGLMALSLEDPGKCGVVRVTGSND